MNQPTRLPIRSFILVAASLICLCAGPGLAQSERTGKLTGSVDGQNIDIELDCSNWGNEQRQVFSLDDDRGRSDANGDGILFTFSHFAPVAMTDATVTIGGQPMQVGPAFRAENDAKWTVEEYFAVFDGPSGAAGDIPVSLKLDCAPRSAEQQGYVGSVTGIVDSIEINAPLSCETWEDAGITQEQTSPDASVSVELLVMRQSGQGTVIVDTGADLYQMFGMRNAFDITSDTITFTASLRRSDDTRYDVSLTFDCSARASQTEPENVRQLRPLPDGVTTGADFTISLAGIPASPGDLVVITDGSPGWLFTVMRSGDEVVLTAPTEPGDYTVEYLTGPDLKPSVKMEIIVK